MIRTEKQQAILLTTIIVFVLPPIGTHLFPKSGVSLQKTLTAAAQLILFQLHRMHRGSQLELDAFLLTIRM